MQSDKSQYEEQLPDRPDFISELTDLINKHSIEGYSNTPDFILAKYLQQCLGAWNIAVTHRDKWYGSAKTEATDSSSSTDDHANTKPTKGSES